MNPERKDEMKRLGMWVALVLLFSGWASLPGLSQETNPTAGKDVKVTVTVERQGSKTPGTLHANDVLVYQTNQRRPVVQWVPATGEHGGLDLAILIDNSLNPAIGSHYGELKDFIRSLPAGSKVAVAYAAYGSAEMAQNFTSDKEQAISALRLPQGQLNQSASIFMALSDLVKHWPSDQNRHVALVLSDGIDLYWGVTEALPSNNPNLHRAIADAQRQGVNVYSIYAETRGRVHRNAFLVNTGQSCLSLLSLATGGKFYSQGLQTPIDFQPIFRQVETRLGNQYRLTFRAEQGKKDSYAPLHVTTEQPGIELVAPSRVYVPAK